MAKNQEWPKLGCGVGLRPKHYAAVTRDWPKQVDWFEAISENYMDSGGRPLAVLEQVRSRYPVALHGVALSIGSIDPLNQKYLSRLKALADRIQPAIVSDHLCWAGAGGDQLHDLLPLPFTEESICHVAERVSQVQDFLKRKILLENVSTYVTYKHSVIPEWEFLSEIARRSGCGILLDLNNIYVNAKNHGFNAYDYLEGIPGKQIGQFHMAGHTDMGTFLFDTHSKPVIAPVWGLYREALKRWGQISTLLEWDEDIPEWPELMKECGRVRKIYQEFKGASPTALETKAKAKSITYHSRDAIIGSSKSLKEVQTWMKSRIQPFAKARAGSPLNPQGGAPGEDRMAVYAGGYGIRICEGLKDVYEAVHAILGEDKFLELAEAYAKRYPSHTYNLSLAGEHFPEMLRKHPVKNRPYLKDLAEFEWRISESFHAFTDKPFDRQGLAAMPLSDWEHARLVFQKSVFLFESSWPVLDLWKNRQASRKNFKTVRKKQRILIGRKGVQVRCELLDQNQWYLLKELFSGSTLGKACEKLATFNKAEILPVAEWFSQWVHDGLIAQVRIIKRKAAALKS